MSSTPISPVQSAAGKTSITAAASSAFCASTTGEPRLRGRSLTLGHGERVVSSGLNIDVPDCAFTVIIGPNGCGKSTLLKALARLSRPQAGEVLLDGSLIQQLPTREVARRLGVLPQSARHPEGIRVAELVARGRHPHQDWLGRWSAADQQAIDHAMQATRVADLAGRFVDELSGGQRQRVWIAMVLAQETPLMLLDEPCTFLDLSHQIGLLELLRRLNRQERRTMVAVLHDLNQACRYADHLVVMREGQIVTQGAPNDIVDAALIEQVFDLPCRIIPDPVAGSPMIVPLGEPESL
ncbi:ABC transporter ATP-binding protein [Lautropia dentalis]|uniref:ABC transporter ATP-binding protein n=1 Tax=Lautropia dentalis TaxID=2490857 RepID=A0A426FM85_9BURK|nr:ABC transporter ATP-binding protein [Lautropia dentalis]RRN43797.1 ABC transporter ATP-binding protein [Lautropia dentalis]